MQITQGSANSLTEYKFSISTSILLNILENIQRTISFNGAIIISWRTGRSSHKTGVLKDFANFTGNHLCQSLFYNKFSGLTSATLLKRRLWHRCFPVNCKNFKNTFLYKTLPDDCFRTDYLTNFMAYGFLMFSGGIERN